MLGCKVGKQGIYKNPIVGVYQSVTSSCWQKSLVLLVMISLPAIVLVVSRQFSAALESSAVNDNPQKFYLWATGREFSYCFTYDPHQADAWMFRTGGEYEHSTLDIQRPTPKE